MKRNIQIVLSFILILSQIGCATVVSGQYQDVYIRSNPTGADVSIDGMRSGRTPMVTSLERKKRHVVKVSKPGYETVTRATTRGFNWWFLGNLIFGGLVGLVVDPITGAIYEVNPDVVYVDFDAPDAIETKEIEEEGSVED